MPSKPRKYQGTTLQLLNTGLVSYYSLSRSMVWAVIVFWLGDRNVTQRLIFQIHSLFLEPGGPSNFQGGYCDPVDSTNVAVLHEKTGTKKDGTYDLGYRLLSNDEKGLR
jgi:hypothetical protein